MDKDSKTLHYSQKKIKNIEQEIYEEFKLLMDDEEAYLDHLMDLGDQLESISEDDKNEQNRTSGCISAVWIIAEVDDHFITFKGDSNTKITKGLMALLFRILNNSTIDAIINYDLSFFEKIHLESFIGTQRKGGLASILHHMKQISISHL